MIDWEKAKEKFGDYLLDASKLIFAGVVINAIYNSAENHFLQLIWYGLSASMFLCFVGVFWTSKKK